MAIDPLVGMETSSVGESQSNGLVDRAIQTIQGDNRALKLGKEARSNISLRSQYTFGLWLEVDARRLKEPSGGRL